jgi:hypothetical protein
MDLKIGDLSYRVKEKPECPLFLPFPVCLFLCEDYADDLRKALDGIDTGPAEAMLRLLETQSPEKVVEDAELLALLGN